MATSVVAYIEPLRIRREFAVLKQLVTRINKDRLTSDPSGWNYKTPRPKSRRTLLYRAEKFTNISHE